MRPAAPRVLGDPVLDIVFSSHLSSFVLGETEAEVLDFSRDKILNLQIVFLAIVAFMDGASVDLTITLPVSVIAIRPLKSRIRQVRRFDDEEQQTKALVKLWTNTYFNL